MKRKTLFGVGLVTMLILAVAVAIAADTYSIYLPTILKEIPPVVETPVPTPTLEPSATPSPTPFPGLTPQAHLPAILQGCFRPEEFAFRSGNALFTLIKDEFCQDLLTQVGERLSYSYIWSPDGKKIAKIYDSRYTYLSVVNADGSGRIALSLGDIDCQPWSPDGTKLVAQTRSLYIFNVDGTGSTFLTEGNRNYDAAWSPDGSQIAFGSNRGDWIPDIYVINSDGTGLTRLTHDAGIDSSPTWSPDGSQIAFVSEWDDNREIYVIQPDGTGLTNLTNHPAWDFNPRWSPSGETIIFISVRDGNYEIYKMNPDGTGKTNLTNDPTDNYISCQPWSPDGSRIVFDSERDGNSEIYIMNADGSNQRRFTFSPEDERGPAWRPRP